MLYVVKIGGAAGVNRAAVARDVAELTRRGERVVLVHGCSQAADTLAEALGTPTRYVTSASGVRSRYTDAAALRVFTLAASQVNAELVLALHELGAQALGLSGPDGALLRATRKETLRIVEDGRPRVLRGDFTGRVEGVNASLLMMLLDTGYIPVVAPLALASTEPDDATSALTAVNVDGDRAAAAIAARLEADALVILSNVPGALADVADERTLLARLSPAEAEAFEARVTGGMRRKLLGAREALRGGVRQVMLADGRIERPLRAALAGRGTVIA